MLSFPDPNSISLADRWESARGELNLQTSDARDKFYRGSYQFILAHFERCQFHETDRDCQGFWQALILVYSWMGRGLLTDFSSPRERYGEVCEPISRVRETGEIDLKTVNKLVRLCNGSVIATSKFLHFLKPDAFAIWDSRVYNSIFERKALHYRLNNPSNMLAYVDWIKLLHIDEDTLEAVASHLGIAEDRGALRAKEYILFMSGGSRELVEGP